VLVDARPLLLADTRPWWYAQPLTTYMDSSRQVGGVIGFEGRGGFACSRISGIWDGRVMARADMGICGTAAPIDLSGVQSGAIVVIGGTR